MFMVPTFASILLFVLVHNTGYPSKQMKSSGPYPQGIKVSKHLPSLTYHASCASLHELHAHFQMCHYKMITCKLRGKGSNHSTDIIKIRRK